MAESLGSVRTVLAFNAAARTAEEYDEVRYHGVHISEMRCSPVMGCQSTGECTLL